MMQIITLIDIFLAWMYKKLSQLWNYKIFIVDVIEGVQNCPLWQIFNNFSFLWEVMAAEILFNMFGQTPSYWWTATSIYSKLRNYKYLHIMCVMNFTNALQYEHSVCRNESSLSEQHFASFDGLVFRRLVLS